jgi:hypothetical protein
MKASSKAVFTMSIVAGLSAPALLFSAAAVQAAVEEGAAREIPWSGYWWPSTKGELLVPLGKYDHLTDASSASWERQNNPPGPTVPAWHGCCHAWAASAILEREPKTACLATGTTGRPLTLAVGDQKGLLAASHSADVSNTYGDRFGDGEGSEDRLDIAPDTLWRLLKMYIKEQKTPLVVDFEAGQEVWNYPVYAYRVTHAPQGNSGQHSAKLELWAADNAVPSSYTGTKVYYQTYWFTFQLRSGSIVMGSGRWTGNSVQNHPDFAWYPYVVVSQNPEVEYAQVKKLLESPPIEDPAASPYNDPRSGSTASGAWSGTAPGSDSGLGVLTQGRIPVGPTELVAAIAEKTSAFNLDVTVNRFDGGHYSIGEVLSVSGTSERAGYLYLFHIDSRGRPSLLHPQGGRANRIQAGERFFAPEPKRGFRLRGPVGVERIKALVTERPLMLTGLAASSQVDSEQKGLLRRRYKLQPFRWPPSQRAQVQSAMAMYQQHQQLSENHYDGIDPHVAIGPFAQDEVAYYVGPAADTEPTQESKKQR